jgi:predicted SnoaL-like aldol condensation-catalyzing enzyme
MDNQTLIQELEFIYRKLLETGDFAKAQEVLIKLTDMKSQNESGTPSGKNILLG